MLESNTSTEDLGAPPGFPIPLYKDLVQQNIFVGAMQHGSDVADHVFQRMTEPCNSQTLSLF